MTKTVNMGLSGLVCYSLNWVTGPPLTVNKSISSISESVKRPIDPCVCPAGRVKGYCEGWPL